MNMLFDELPNEYLNYDKFTARLLEELFNAIDSNIDTDTVFIYDLLDTSINILDIIEYIYRHYNLKLFFISATIEAGIDYIIDSPKKYSKHLLKRYIKHIKYYYVSEPNDPHPTDIILDYDSIKTALMRCKMLFRSEKDLVHTIDYLFESFEASPKHKIPITFAITPEYAQYISVTTQDLKNIFVKFDEIVLTWP
jgi:hypothetical protein